MRITLSAVFCLSVGMQAISSSAMDLETAINIALQSNPEIAEASANRRAIDFEYEQARRLNRPSIIVDGRVGPEWVDSRTTRLLGNDEDVLFGRQASVTFQQNLLSFGRNNAERDRQASRVDAAAYRVKERSELIGLDVVQAYLDVMRLREIVDFADQNVAFHEGKVSEISRGVSGGVKSEADAQQARERLSAAKISRSETEEAMDLAEVDFRRVVGQDIGQTSLPKSIAAKLPTTLEAALGQARKNNPTLRIANTDLDTARAEYRKAKSDLKPELMFEVVGRAGDDIGGFRDTSNDARAQLRFRYEFRGGIKSSVVQEQLNRVDEARARIMTLERNVESLIRQAWATRQRTALRVQDLDLQVGEGTRLLDSYQREFGIGRRTLLDILDAEASLFQAKTSLTTAKYADLFSQYRLMAATGDLLDVFTLAAPREADTSLRALEKVEAAPAADTEPRRYPNHYDETMGNSSQGQMMSSLEILSTEETVDIANVQIRPIIRKSASPQEAAEAMAAIDDIANHQTSEALQTDDGLKTEAAKSTVIVDTQSNLEVAEIYQMAEAQSTPSNAISAASTSDSVALGTIPEAIMLGEAEYMVMTGDTLYSIAKLHNVPLQTLKSANGINDNIILSGQILTIPEAIDHPNPVIQTAHLGSTLPEVNAWPAIAVEQTPLLEAEDNLIAQGHPVETVDSEKFKALAKRDGAKTYDTFQAILLDETLYLKEN